MKTFKEIIALDESANVVELTEEKTYYLALIEALSLMNSDELNESKMTLEEGVMDKLSDFGSKVKTQVGKVGLHIKKSKGLIEYVASITKGTGLIFLHLIKGDVAKATELLKTIQKEDVIDFLMKLDLVAFHFISGPIHTLDAITGWHVGAAVASKIKSAEQKFAEVKQRLVELTKHIEEFFIGKHKKKSLAGVKTLEHLISLHELG